jgi:hypothetical protein
MYFRRQKCIEIYLQSSTHLKEMILSLIQGKFTFVFYPSNSVSLNRINRFLFTMMIQSVYYAV